MAGNQAFFVICVLSQIAHKPLGRISRKNGPDGAKRLTGGGCMVRFQISLGG